MTLTRYSLGGLEAYAGISRHRPTTEKEPDSSDVQCQYFLFLLLVFLFWFHLNSISEQSNTQTSNKTSKCTAAMPHISIIVKQGSMSHMNQSSHVTTLLQETATVSTATINYYFWFLFNWPLFCSFSRRGQIPNSRLGAIEQDFVHNTAPSCCSTYSTKDLKYLTAQSTASLNDRNTCFIGLK